MSASRLRREAAAREAKLRRVERAAHRLVAANNELHEAIQAASDAGLPLRPIATAAGFSVEWTRRIVAKAS